MNFKVDESVLIQTSDLLVCSSSNAFNRGRLLDQKTVLWYQYQLMVSKVSFCTELQSVPGSVHWNSVYGRYMFSDGNVKSVNIISIYCLPELPSNIHRMSVPMEAG